MAISTQGVTLYSDTTTISGSSAKLVDIKDFPELIGTPNALEATTLTDTQQTYINGIKQASVLEFTANYTEDDYDAILAKCATDTYFCLAFGTFAVNEGLFTFQGELSVSVLGAGVDGVVEMKISIAPSTAVTKE
jgi:hypothetical protein